MGDLLLRLQTFFNQGSLLKFYLTNQIFAIFIIQGFRILSDHCSSFIKFIKFRRLNTMG